MFGAPSAAEIIIALVDSLAVKRAMWKAEKH